MEKNGTFMQRIPYRQVLQEGKIVGFKSCEVFDQNLYLLIPERIKFY